MQDADEKVDGEIVTQQRRFLIHTHDDGTLDQQGEPVRQQPISEHRGREAKNKKCNTDCVNRILVRCARVCVCVFMHTSVRSLPCPKADQKLEFAVFAQAA